jgi:hypothetical protein
MQSVSVYLEYVEKFRACSFTSLRSAMTVCVSGQTSSTRSVITTLSVHASATNNKLLLISMSS